MIDGRRVGATAAAAAARFRACNARASPRMRPRACAREHEHTTTFHLLRCLRARSHASTIHVSQVERHTLGQCSQPRKLIWPFKSWPNERLESAPIVLIGDKRAPRVLADFMCYGAYGRARAHVALQLAMAA